MAEEGYTTIFHLGEEGVTIHQEGSISITMTEPPVLYGRKLNREKLWTVLARSKTHKQEEANNVYSLSSIPQSIKYLHAVAGFPVKERWIIAIQAGNYVTWPGLTAATVQKHFPDSDEMQKGHMKKQRQGVRSTGTRDNTKQEEKIHKDPPPKKMQDVFIKIHNAAATMHSDQTGHFPVTSSRGNQYIMVLIEVDGNYIDAKPMKSKS